VRLIAKAIRISRAKFHCSRLTTVHDIQDYACLIFWVRITVTVTVGNSELQLFASVSSTGATTTDVQCSVW